MENDSFLEAAEQFQKLLELRAKEKISLGGGSRLQVPKQSIERVNEFTQNKNNLWLSDMSPRTDDNQSMLAYALERFELMVNRINKRVEIDIPLDLRQKMYSIFAMHFIVIVEAIGSTKEKFNKLLCSTILYNPSWPLNIFNEAEFGWCADTPSIVQYALVNSPSGPREFLRKMKIDMDSIGEESEFGWCDEYVIKRAALNYPTDPRSFLRKVKKNADKIELDPEFDWCRKMPSLVRIAIINYAADPVRYLRDKKDEVELLIRETNEEEEFEWCRGENRILVRAITSADPKRYIRSVKVEIDKIASESEFEWCPPNLITRTAIGFSSSIRAVLKKNKKKIDEISEDPEFSHLSKTKIIYSVFYYTDVKTYLRSGDISL